MKHILLITILLVSSLGFSQTLKPMTWSGIITDNSGNPLENTNVNLKFSIYLDDIETYSETQSQTTNEKGFVTANIGLGTMVLGNYDSTLLNTLNSKLKIEVDTGSGFVTLQDGPISAVPMAKASEVAYVLSYKDNEVNVTGSDISFTRGNQLVGRFSDEGLRLESLVDFSETQNVPVVVTPSGILKREIITPNAPQEKYLSISAAELAMLANNDDLAFFNQGLVNNNPNNPTNFNVLKNINLPHGATIINIKYYCYDVSPTSDFLFFFKRREDNVEITPPYHSSNLNNTLTPYPGQNVIDNKNYSYYLIIKASPNIPTNESTYMYTLSLKKIVITYTE